MTDRIVILVARPTPSGVDDRALRALRDAVTARQPDPVHIAYLDHAAPDLHTALDQAVTAGVTTATILPTAVPTDPYLTTWISRAAANWTETRPGTGLKLRISPPLGATDALADAVAALAREPGRPITTSPAAFRSPAWSVLDVPARHLLVCRGPRCSVYGAAATHRALAAATRGTDTQVTPTGCLGPCNLGPLVIDNPDGTWHQHIDATAAATLATPGRSRTAYP